MNSLKKLALSIAVVAITAGATNGLMGGTLTAIPTLSGDTSNEGRTIAPDGLWVGGLSGTRGFLYDVNTANVFNVLSADGAQSSGVVGLGYRYEGSQQEIIMGGLSSGWNTDYMTTNGTAFPNKRRDTSVGSNPRVPVTNARAGTSSDVYYETWWDANPSGYQIYVGQFSGTWPAAVTPAWDIKGIPNGIVCEMHGISSTGRAVGWRGSPKANYVLDWKGIGTPGQWNFYGLDGTTVGEAFAVSADGTAVFGQSPVSDGRPGNWGYKTVLAATMPGPAVQLSTNELPNFVDTDGSGGSAAVPYGCTADGNLAVGMSYRGLEKAVLWDTADPNPANWTVTDLTDLATSEGTLGNFTRLSRAYSVSKNGAGNPVITGIGSYFDGVSTVTRAFVMMVSPATVARPIITSVVGAGTASVTVNFTNTIPTTNYILRYNTNLSTTNWYDISPPLTAVGYAESITDTTAAGSPRRYYRILMQ